MSFLDKTRLGMQQGTISELLSFFFLLIRDPAEF